MGEFNPFLIIWNPSNFTKLLMKNIDCSNPLSSRGLVDIKHFYSCSDADALTDFLDADALEDEQVCYAYVFVSCFYLICCIKR